jgi:hypothetical protein
VRARAAWAASILIFVIWVVSGVEASPTANERIEDQNSTKMSYSDAFGFIYILYTSNTIQTFFPISECDFFIICNGKRKLWEAQTNTRRQITFYWNHVKSYIGWKEAIFFDDAVLYSVADNSRIDSSVINADSANNNRFIMANLFIHQENSLEANDWPMSGIKFIARQFYLALSSLGAEYCCISGPSRYLETDARLLHLATHQIQLNPEEGYLTNGSKNNKRVNPASHLV